MTSIENNLALEIIKEKYGHLAKLISSLLIKKKSYPIQLIANDLNIEIKTVKFFILMM
jgi:hypothetical protein